MLFAFCGIDGSGKTTVIDNVYKKLRVNHSKVEKTKVNLESLKIWYEYSEKYFSDIYEFYDAVNPDLVRIGVALDFVKHYKRKKFDSNAIVLCDRFSMCYLACGLAYGMKEVETMNKMFNLVEEPVIYFYFDIEPDRAIERLIGRFDYNEREENFELLCKVKMAYDKLLANKKNVVTINANLKCEQITEVVYNTIAETCSLHKN